MGGVEGGVVEEEVAGEGFGVCGSLGLVLALGVFFWVRGVVVVMVKG